MVYDPKLLKANDPERVIIRLMSRPYLKFKHDNDGVYKYFISLWGKEMKFYFSITEFEAHWALHHGDYTHHVFKDFDQAFEFYRSRMNRYGVECYPDEIRSEYRLSLRKPEDMPMW